MNGPESLLHVVCGEKVHDAGKLQEKVVLEAENRCRSHDGGLRVDTAGDLLSACL